MRLFLDANVLFSAARDEGGRASALFVLAGKLRLQLLASPHAIEEARRNLEIKEPDCLPRLNSLLGRLVVCPESSEEVKERARAQRLPAKDAPILGAAMQANADFLVTGDRTHFGHLYGKTVDGVRIVTPAEALAELLTFKRAERYSSP